MHRRLPLVLVATLFLPAARAIAHGFVGDFFFPATIATDDPLATDELAFLTSGIPGDDFNAQFIAASFEFDKVIIPHLALGISDDYSWTRPTGGHTAHGWDDLTLSAKYELWRNDAHAAIVSVGLESELGGLGSRSVDRNSFSTFTPTLYFGKGFSDLPDSLAYLKPVAITGTVGLDLPTEAADPNSIEWGLAFEYNIPYLQQHVHDFSLPEPFKNMIPLVEIAADSPFNRHGGETLATVNPGVLFETKYFQVGVEAIIPMNRESGDRVGGVIQLQVYIDDIFPKLFGSPIFGE